MCDRKWDIVIHLIANSALQITYHQNNFTGNIISVLLYFLELLFAETAIWNHMQKKGHTSFKATIRQKKEQLNPLLFLIFL